MRRLKLTSSVQIFWEAMPPLASDKIRLWKRRIREKAQTIVVNDAILYHKNQDNVLCRVVVDDAEKRVFYRRCTLAPSAAPITVRMQRLRKSATDSGGEM